MQKPARLVDSVGKKVSKTQEGRIEIPLARVQILIDVIFASAMTIMVLAFELPDPGLEWTDVDRSEFGQHSN